MTRGRRRRRKLLEAPEPLENVLARAGEDRFAKVRPPISFGEWRAAVGARIADRARPIRVDSGVLLVKVTTSVWASELSMLAPELMRRLAERGLAVSALRFRVGPLEVAPRPPERRATRRVPAPVALPVELDRAVARIADDELRAIVDAAARANLAWQSFVTVPAAPEEAASNDDEDATNRRQRSAASRSSPSRR